MESTVKNQEVPSWSPPTPCTRAECTPVALLSDRKHLPLKDGSHSQGKNAPNVGGWNLSQAGLQSSTAA